MPLQDLPVPYCQNSNALIVLGMHRCGTSALSGALHILGTDLGPYPVARGDDNPTGFWEHPGIVALHEKFLAAAGASWNEVSAFAPGWREGEGAAWLRSELKEILLKDFGSSPLWSVKDPRLCRLLPLWLPVLAGAGIRPGFVIMSRSPLEVAASLRKRNGLDDSRSHLLWLQHMLAAEKSTRGSRRTFLTYPELLNDPSNALKKIAFDLNIIWPRSVDRMQSELRSFLSPSLRHHHASEKPSDDEASSLCQLALTCARVLESGGVSAGAHFEASLDAIAATLGDGLALLDSEKQRRLLRQEIAALQEIARRKEELETMVSARDEGIWHLKSEVTWRSNRIAELEKSVQAMDRKLEALQQDRALELEATARWKSSPYWRFCALLRHPKKEIPGIFKNRKRSDCRSIQQGGEELAAAIAGPAPSASEPIEPTAPEIAVAPKPDAFDELVIRPTLASEDLLRILNHPVNFSPRRCADIISFSIIDWEFRYQRPQQVMAQFARAGHRVFYLSLARLLPLNSRPRFTVRQIQENVFEVSVAVLRPLDTAARIVGGLELDTILESLDELRRAWNINDAVAYVMIASWEPVAAATKHRWGWKLLYDCMDEWQTFQGIHPAIPQAEGPLVRQCDLVVTTARRLYEKWLPAGRPTVLARNAVDIDFYERHYGPNTLLDGLCHPIIGFYGGIEDWFDLELMIHIARARPGYTFVLVGGVHGRDLTELERLPNVHLCGLQPYERMPRYLYHFDVCIIPFKLNEVTRATDPVKFYEYVSSGKPVVSVNLPELEQYRDYLYLADTKEEFELKLDAALQERDPVLVERRKELARQNSWNHRVGIIKKGLAGVTPLASIIIVTFGNLALTRLCIESVLRDTGHPNFEVIVVDNASEDGTPSYLSFIGQRDPRIKVVLNSKNAGFAAANNQGLAVAAGAHLVLLNNDTIVPSGWLTRMLHHLDDPRIGLVGPRTNFAGNEAWLEAGYTTWRGMEQFAAEHTWANDGRVADIAMLAMFCMAMRRDTFEKLGPLDEQFGIGLFEDDDYSQRAKQAGYRVVCAGDVFVHHFGQMAFKDLEATGEYARLFAENQRRYEQKWNLTWEKHHHAELAFVQRRDQSGGLGRPPLKAQGSHPSAETPGTGKAAENPDYAGKLAKESGKWGSHLQLEAGNEWHAWLCHPLVLENYQRRSLVDGLAWPLWVRKVLDGPVRRSLDLGCGSGGTSLKLHSMGAAQSIEGIDVSGERVAQAEKHRIAAGIDGGFRVGDANRLRLPANTYDLIVSSHSFHHFVELERIMEQVHEALTPDGFFILEEFVGPTQFQWTDLQMQMVKERLAIIPERLRIFRWGALKSEEGRPTPAEVEAESPFESIRSGEIVPLFHKYFDVVGIRKLGGTLQHLLFNGIAHQFLLADDEAVRQVKDICAFENNLIDEDVIPSDFMLLIGRRRGAGKNPHAENPRV